MRYMVRLCALCVAFALVAGFVMFHLQMQVISLLQPWIATTTVAKGKDNDIATKRTNVSSSLSDSSNQQQPVSYVDKSSSLKASEKEERILPKRDATASTSAQMNRNDETTASPREEIDWENEVLTQRPWDDANLFTFPTVNQRVRYYMGGWHDTNSTKVNFKLMCKELVVHPRMDLNGPIIGKPLLLNITNLQKAAQDGGMGRHDISFQRYAKDVVETFVVNTQSADFEMILFVGDSFVNPYYPVVLKSRKARSGGVPLEREPILALLHKVRHYQNVDRLLQQHADIVAAQPKRDTVFWRGASTGRRLPIVERYFNYSRRDIDVAFSELVQKYHGNETVKALVRPKKRLEEMLTYKYLLSLEGNDVASGLKWMLYSSSVVMMPPPTRVTWAMEDFLIPFHHYIPLKGDASDLPEKLAWARKHPDECRKISQRATQFMFDLYVSPQAKLDNQEIFRKMARRYQSNFAMKLRQCHSGNHKRGRPRDRFEALV